MIQEIEGDIDWDDILKEIRERIYTKENPSKSDVEKIKRQVGRDHHLPKLPKNWEILTSTPEEKKEQIRKAIGKQKPVRTISGVAPIAVMTAPLECPGNCIYCLGGVKSEFSSPKSYTGNEPAARRAKNVNYNPYNQVKIRLKQYTTLGHKPRKCHIIIMGGTFLSADQAYKEMFIRGIYTGLLGKQYPEKSLADLQGMLEHSKHRITGMTIETRPDWCYKDEIDEMLRYGTTRVEIGIQTLNEKILQKVRRGHKRKAVKKSFRLAKNSAFKIVGHTMLNLPGSSPEKDLNSFRELFNNPDFRPDMLKIYPTTIVKGSKLYEMWKNGEYTPYSEEKVIKTIAKMLKELPPYVRVQRVQRDIPLWLVENYQYGNLREMAWQYMEKKGWKRKGIRSKEVGHKMRKENMEPKIKDIKLVKRTYEASQGKETFLSFEDVKRNILVGLLRLRKPNSRAHREEIDLDTTLVRELHVFGPLVPPHHKEEKKAWQHRGYGKKLLKHAEITSKRRYNASKIIVISGIGVREYYRKLGYTKIGPYMGKNLR